MSEGPAAGEFEACFGGLAAIGRDPTGGWTRLAWTDEDHAARAWFESEATARGLTVEQDSAGNLWAWWGGGRGMPADPSGGDRLRSPTGGPTPAGPGRARPQAGPSRSGATWTRSGAAGPTTGPWAWSAGWSRWAS